MDEIGEFLLGETVWQHYETRILPSGDGLFVKDMNSDRFWVLCLPAQEIAIMFGDNGDGFGHTSPRTCNGSQVLFTKSFSMNLSLCEAEREQTVRNSHMKQALGFMGQ